VPSGRSRKKEKRKKKAMLELRAGFPRRGKKNRQGKRGGGGSIESYFFLREEKVGAVFSHQPGKRAWGKKKKNRSPLLR